MRHAAESGAELVRRLMAFARKQELTPDQRRPAQRCAIRSPGWSRIRSADRSPSSGRCPRTALHLFVDKAQLELALVNLIVNARDAMPDGGKIVVAIDEAAPSRATTARADFRGSASATKAAAFRPN